MLRITAAATTTTAATTIIVILLPHVSYAMIAYKNAGFELSSTKYFKNYQTYFSVRKGISFQLMFV